MKKYRIVSKGHLIKKKQIAPWEVEYRRSLWRERFIRRKDYKRIIYFGDPLCSFPSDEDVVDTVLHRTYLKKLPKILSLLRDDEREIIEAYYYEQKSDQIIAQDIGVTSQAVGKKRRRVLLKMLKLLNEEK